MRGIQRPFHFPVEASTDLRVIAVANGVDEKVFEAALLEHFSQDVEHAAAQGGALNFQLLEKSLEDIAFPGLCSHHVPEVADLRLADTVDTAKPLLQTIRIPRKVVIDHQVGVLKVHTLAGRIGCQQHSDLGIVAEQLLNLAAVFAFDAAMDVHHRFIAAQQPANLDLKVVERVAVLGEDDELALTTLGVAHLRGLLQQLGKLIPLAVFTRVNDGAGLLLQRLKAEDFRFQLLDRLSCSGLVHHRFLKLLVVLWSERVSRVPYVFRGTLLAGVAVAVQQPLAPAAQLLFFNAAGELDAAAA